MTKPRGILACGALRKIGSNHSLSVAEQHSLSESKATNLAPAKQVKYYHSPAAQNPSKIPVTPIRHPDTGTTPGSNGHYPRTLKRPFLISLRPM